MGKTVDDEIFRYTFNMFAFPQGYFEEKTAEELGISEEARQKLIAIQNEPKPSPEEIQAQREKEFDEFVEKYFSDDYTDDVFEEPEVKA